MEIRKNFDYNVDLHDLVEIKRYIDQIRQPSGQMSFGFGGDSSSYEKISKIKKENIDVLILSFLGMIRESSNLLNGAEIDIYDYVNENEIKDQVYSDYSYLEIDSKMVGEYIEQVFADGNDTGLRDVLKEYFSEKLEKMVDYEDFIKRNDKIAEIKAEKISKRYENIGIDVIKNNILGRMYIKEMWKNFNNEARLVRHFYNKIDMSVISKLFTDTFRDYGDIDIGIDSRHSFIKDLCDDLVDEICVTCNGYSVKNIFTGDMIDYIAESQDLEDDIRNNHINWHFDRYRDNYLDSLQENAQSDFRQLDRSLRKKMSISIPTAGGVHNQERYNGPISYLASDEISVTDLLMKNDLEEMLDEMYDWDEVTLNDFYKIGRSLLDEVIYLKNGSSAGICILSHVNYILEIIKSDDGLGILLSKGLEEDVKDINRSYVKDMISSYMEENREIFDLYTNREKQEEYKRAEEERIRRRDADADELEQERSDALSGKGERKSSEEELRKMKELGIADKPFSFSNRFDVGAFPGHAVFPDLERKGISFMISFYPSKNIKIPDSVYKDMQLHNLPQAPSDYSPGIGWVGGYYVKSENAMYIVEVQSDIMQRIKFLKDPNKSSIQKKEEISRLSTEIDNLRKKNSFIDSRLSNKVEDNPRALQRIKLIKDTLSRTDKNDPLYINLNNELERYKKDMGFILTPQKVSQMQNEKLSNEKKIETYNNEINRLRKEIVSDDDFLKGIPAWEKRYHKPEYHDYKNFVEQYLKDWIGIFFNTVMRYAKENNVSKVHIITPNNLIKRWSSYSSNETYLLFNRIYDKWSRFYNATSSSNWYTIDVSKIKVASIKGDKMGNWYRKIKTANFDKKFWKIHFDTYMNTYLKTMKDPILSYSQADENNIKREAFENWMSTIPSGLRDYKGDILPEFESEVIKYCKEKWNFDPYSTYITEDVEPWSVEEMEREHNREDIPSAKDLDEQWGK